MYFSFERLVCCCQQFISPVIAELFCQGLSCSLTIYVHLLMALSIPNAKLTAMVESIAC